MRIRFPASMGLARFVASATPESPDSRFAHPRFMAAYDARRTQSIQQGFVHDLGPETEGLLSPEVIKHLHLDLAASPEVLAEQWRPAFALVKQLHERQSLSAEQIAEAMIELQRDPEGSLAQQIAAGQTGMSID